MKFVWNIYFLYQLYFNCILWEVILFALQYLSYPVRDFVFVLLFAKFHFINWIPHKITAMFLKNRKLFSGIPTFHYIIMFFKSSGGNHAFLARFTNSFYTPWRSGQPMAIQLVKNRPKSILEWKFASGDTLARFLLSANTLLEFHTFNARASMLFKARISIEI